MPNRLGVNVGNSMQHYLMKNMTYMFFIFSICFFSTNAFGTILNVGPGNYQTIQQAIDAATDGETIVVADGTYRGSGNKNLDFKGKAITLISENGSEKSIIDCEGNGSGFYFHSGERPSSIVSGFSIINGRANQGGGHGGGIICINSSPTISNCIIRNNSTYLTYGDYYGGGIYSDSNYYPTGHSPKIINCMIIDNLAGRHGGGVFIRGASWMQIINCTITGNSCSKAFDASGGGIDSSSVNPSTITNCIVWGNSPNDGLTGEFTIYSSPAFVDPEGGDYHLKDYSPCIGAGTSTGSPDTDIEGKLRPNPPGTNPDIGAFENNRGTPDNPPLGIFGIEIGNRWVYQGTKKGNPNTVKREVIGFDQTTFPTDTYVFEIRENGFLQAGEWYGKTAVDSRLWSSGGYGFTAGLLSAWYPMAVGDHRETSANVVGFPGAGISLTVDVLSKGNVNLSFGTLEAYELSYQVRTWGPGGDVTETFWWWVAPHLGVVKDQRAESLVELTSFAIGGGTITQATDYDGDGLEDYRELLIYKTNWQYPDTDQDGLNDSEEISIGTDPTRDDTDGDGLKDGWEVQYGFDPLDTNNAQQDPDDDNLNNLEEQSYGTNPRLRDTDQDGLDDGQEISMGTDPNDADTDDDGIPDGVEDANHNGSVDSGETDPRDADTDNDGIQDGTEAGYTDGHPTDTDPAIFQPDQDDTTTTDPLNPDSDEDGFKDGDEDLNHNGKVDEGEENPRETCQRDPVRIWGVVPSYFNDIQSCYDAAIDGDIIEIHGIGFDQDIVCDRDVSITLRPGYLCDYLFSPPATTSLQGSLTITNGTIRFGDGCMKIGD